ncbi:nuclear transport factor 2 family protein [Pseudomaricurvus sp. HS19]|uniref:nuclear transport factor 2 family protein n=1 Tax=Pseudomaricurvus sp. HS19 TaxID=2692626 RepID=UPI001371ECD7|nr:nuclear transport factor 2 family protein [Pseudomaricurvus sp. HS19]MYM61911.1 nuclear transport factor 2 family protein [Pseudomaricurvus sp. HS19]
MSSDYTLEELGVLLDRENIRNCIARLARGEDRRCDARIRACFWPEAQTDFGIFAGNFDEYLNWVVPGSPAVLLTQHMLAQSLVRVEGNLADAETHVTSYHRVDMGEEQRDMVIGGRYLDRLEKRGKVWRIIERTMLYDWAQDWGPSADWSQGLMGQPFSGDHFVGQTFDDYSEQFF